MLAEQRVDRAERRAPRCALSVGVPGRAGCTEMPSRAQARVNVSDTNTLPWSITIVSGTITGRAAASSIRASMSSSRACGSRERRHPQRRRPARPHRLGHQHPGQQQRRVDRLGADRPQHRRADRAGRDVHRDRQVRPHRHPVIQQHHHVDRGGVDLHLLTRPGGERRGEQPCRPVRGLPAGHRRPERVPAGRPARRSACRTWSGPAAGPRPAHGWPPPS